MTKLFVLTCPYTTVNFLLKFYSCTIQMKQFYFKNKTLNVIESNSATSNETQALCAVSYHT